MVEDETLVDLPGLRTQAGVDEVAEGLALVEVTPDHNNAWKRRDDERQRNKCQNIFRIQVFYNMMEL